MSAWRRWCGRSRGGGVVGGDVVATVGFGEISRVSREATGLIYAARADGDRAGRAANCVMISGSSARARQSSAWRRDETGHALIGDSKRG